MKSHIVATHRLSGTDHIMWQVSHRAADSGPVSIGAAADTLWIITIQLRRDLFPPEAIDQGPPFFGEE